MHPLRQSQYYDVYDCILHLHSPIQQSETYSSVANIAYISKQKIPPKRDCISSKNKDYFLGAAALAGAAAAAAFGAAPLAAGPAAASS